MHWLQIKYYNQIRYVERWVHSWIDYFKQNYFEVCREHEYEMLRIEYNQTVSRPPVIYGVAADA